jgi:hypothetical protein
LAFLTSIADAQNPSATDLSPFRMFLGNWSCHRTAESRGGVQGFAVGMDQIELIVKENILTVTAKSERRAFTRSLKLPDDVDPQAIEATVDNGLLTLVLTRHPDAQPRRIEIKQRA